MDYSKHENEKKKKSHKSKTKKVTKKISLLMFRTGLIVFIIAAFAAVGAGLGVYMGIIENAPSLEQLKMEVTPNIYTSIIFEDKSGKEIDRLQGGENREYVTSNQIPDNLKHAFVAIEDERFYNHDGVDFAGALRAVVTNLTTDRKEGASTITQQLVKNNVLKINKNSYETKLQEQYLAITYEKWLKETMHSKEKAKDYILELYLNTIGLAHGLYGVQAASLRYFDKNVSDLTLAECAVIAAITQNPTKYSPINHPDSNKKRQSTILKYMFEQGYISESEYDSALAEDVYSNISAVSTAQAATSSYHSYFVDQLISEVYRDLQERLNYSATLANFTIYNSGLQIYATIDTEMQEIVDDVYLNHDELFPSIDYEILVNYRLTKKNQISGKTTNHEKNDYVKKQEDIDALVFKMQGELLGPDDIIVSEAIYPVIQPQSAFAVIDYYTGQVKALSGGRGEKLANRVLNRATQSPRQPGSVFKVLASFAPALDLGLITPATVYDDVPNYMEDMEKDWPSNWYKNPNYRGLSTVRDGIRNSMNVVTVKNFLRLGATNSFDYLKNFGFSTLVESREQNGKTYTDKTASTALGGITDGVTVLELASAYGTIANSGEYLEPHLYTKILKHDGTTLLENNPTPKQVLKQTTSYLLTDMMKDVITAGTGGKANFKEVKMPIAGKTGTTSDTIDLVFAGYTPYYVGAVWLGHDQPKAIKDSSGYHLQLWRTVMERIHANLPYKDFERPDGIATETICKDSGKLAVPELCSADPRANRVRSELFVTGTQPTEYCDVHKSVLLDIESRLAPTAFCPPENVQQVVGIVRPVPYVGEEFIEDQPYEISLEALGGALCDLHGGYGEDLPWYDDLPVIDDLPLTGGNTSDDQATPTPDSNAMPTIDDFVFNQPQ